MPASLTPARSLNQTRADSGIQQRILTVGKCSNVDRREVSLAGREASLSKRERAQEAMSNAVRIGFEEIVRGHIKGEVELAGRGDLSPAFDLLKMVGSTIAARVKDLRLDLKQRRDQLTEKQLEAERVLEKAVQREAAASAKEEHHRSAMERFDSELKRLRRIYRWAQQINQVVRDKPLRNVDTKLGAALNGMTSEFGPKKEKDGKEL